MKLYFNPQSNMLGIRVFDADLLLVQSTIVVYQRGKILQKELESYADLDECWTCIGEF